MTTLRYTTPRLTTPEEYAIPCDELRSWVLDTSADACDRAVAAAKLAAAGVPVCPTCDDDRWVIDSPTGAPWDEVNAPCPVCNPEGLDDEGEPHVSAARVSRRGARGGGSMTAPTVSEIRTRWFGDYDPAEMATTDNAIDVAALLAEIERLRKAAADVVRADHAVLIAEQHLMGSTPGPDPKDAAEQLASAIDVLAATIETPEVNA